MKDSPKDPAFVEQPSRQQESVEQSTSAGPPPGGALNAVAWTILLCGLIAGAIGFSVWGIVEVEYETVTRWGPGSIAALSAFLPAFFAWGVLRGLSDIKHEIRQERSP